jgi:hypothetical protein
VQVLPPWGLGVSSRLDTDDGPTAAPRHVARADRSSPIALPRVLALEVSPGRRAICSAPVRRVPVRRPEARAQSSGQRPGGTGDTVEQGSLHSRTGSRAPGRNRVGTAMCGSISAEGRPRG